MKGYLVLTEYRRRVTIAGLILALVVPAALARPVQKKRPKMNDIIWGKASEKLTLGLSCPSNNTVRLHLKNVGAQSLRVWSHVEAEETHLDWFTLDIESEKVKTRRTLRLSDSRERSAAIDAILKPGEALHHDLNILDWSGREVNGSKPLTSGEYKVRAVYEIKKDAEHWRGTLEAGPVTLKIAPNAGAKE